MSENQTEQKALVPVGDSGLQFQDMDGLFRFSRAVAQSGLAPKGLEKPEAIFVAIQLGLELGMTPMMALQNIASINGKPSIYGDAALGLVRARGLLENFKEEEVGERGKDSWGFKVSGNRKGEPIGAETFTVEDAKIAQLWAKPGPWTQYPKRMLKFRARGFFLRDRFGDVLKGLRTTEEVRDDPVAMAKPVFDSGIVPSFLEPAPAPAAETPAPPAEDAAKKEEPLPPANPIEELLSKNGFNFDDLTRWAIKTEFYPDADSYGSIGELPEPVLKRLVKAKAGLLAGIKQMKEDVVK